MSKIELSEKEIEVIKAQLNGEIDGCATFQHKRFRQQRTAMEIVEYLHQSHHLFEVVANKALLLGDDVKSLFVI